MDRVLPVTTPNQMSLTPIRLALGLALFALLVAGGWHVATSQMGSALRLFARLGWRLIPPALRFGAALSVLLWLAVVRRAWSEGDDR